MARYGLAEKCVYTHLKMHLSLADKRQKSSSKRRSSSNETKIVGKAMQKTRSFRGVIRILRWPATCTGSVFRKYLFWHWPIKRNCVNYLLKNTTNVCFTCMLLVISLITPRYAHINKVRGRAKLHVVGTELKLGQNFSPRYIFLHFLYTRFFF